MSSSVLDVTHTRHRKNRRRVIPPSKRRGLEPKRRKTSSECVHSSRTCSPHRLSPRQEKKTLLFVDHAQLILGTHLTLGVLGVERSKSDLSLQKGLLSVSTACQKRKRKVPEMMSVLTFGARWESPQLVFGFRSLPVPGQPTARHVVEVHWAVVLGSSTCPKTGTTGLRQWIVLVLVPWPVRRLSLRTPTPVIRWSCSVTQWRRVAKVWWRGKNTSTICKWFITGFQAFVQTLL